MRGSVASKGSDRDSKRGSKRDSSQPGNVQSSRDIRRISIEAPQPITRASTADRVRVREVV